MRRVGALMMGMTWLAALGFVSETAAQTKPYSGTSPKWPINTLKELGEAFYGCFLLPPPDQSRPGMEITVIFSINKAGDIIGEPRFTFLSPNVSPEMRGNYQRSVSDALKRCTPFPLTQSFGDAIAGRPLPFRFTDPRGQRKA